MLLAGIADQEGPDDEALGGPGGLGDILSRIAAAAADLSRLIAGNGLAQDLGGAAGEGAHGDAPKALDLIADVRFMAALTGSGARYYASEEQAESVVLNPSGAWAVAIDPLDGSSNIDVNVSIGTIFSVLPAADTAEATFLRPGRAQAAAGYVIYGPQTVLVLTLGQGVRRWVLDPASGRFQPVGAAMSVPPATDEFAINSSNRRHWPRPIRAFVDDLVAGAEGPRGRNFNMRWIASLVAETHRILTRGGVFLYPADARRGYEQGRLRLLYECAPIAMLVEQAGGLATDGLDPILDKTPAGLHARSPLVFGSAEKVARVAAYHDLPEAETSALFGTRSLFRTETR